MFLKGKLFSKSITITFIIAFIVVIVISVLLNNNVFIPPSETLPSRAEMNLLYANIIEHNEAMLENPIEYGDEYCSGYVSVKKDIVLHKEILAELQQLSDEICISSENDYDKVKAIAYYVAENIYYNEVAAESSVTADTISLENVLNTKTATCAGYSNLFSALCNMQEIYSVNLRGGTYMKDYETSEHLLNVPTNHEWNAVLLDDKWHFIDVTWLSNNVFTEIGYEESDNFDDQYFDIPLEEMSYEHRIDIVDYRNFKSSINALDE